MIMDSLEGANASSSATAAAASNESGSGETMSVADDEDGSMGVAVDVAWTVVYSLMIIVAIAGNAIVMWIVTGIKQPRLFNFFFNLHKFPVLSPPPPSSPSHVERDQLLHRQPQHHGPAQLRLQLHLQLHIHEVKVRLQLYSVVLLMHAVGLQ